MKELAGLYIHIPFCVRKCLYCDFYSEETSRSPLGLRLKEPIPDRPDFLHALERELRELPKDFVPASLFIGGGTPTELSENDFRRLFELIHQHTNLSQVREWTCESNPGTLTSGKIQIMRDAGISRVSLGVQTFSNQMLEFLGRIHSAEEAVEGLDLLRQAGFHNINLDFIYGVPGMHAEESLADAHRAVSLSPSHLSFYCLMFEEGTPLQSLKSRGFVREEDADLQRQTFEQLRKYLTSAGYHQYELSNYSRPGRTCLHNRIVWSGRGYIGCGPGAHSYWNGTRWANRRHLKTYCNGSREDRIEATETRKNIDQAREALTFGLRQRAGVHLPRLNHRFSVDLEADLGDVIHTHCSTGWMVYEKNTLRLTPEAHFVSDHILADFI